MNILGDTEKMIFDFISKKEYISFNSILDARMARKQQLKHSLKWLVSNGYVSTRLIDGIRMYKARL